MKYKLIVFDFDGTLADTLSWFLTIADDLADHFKLKRMDHSQVESLRRMELRKVMQHFGVTAWMLPEIGLYLQNLLSKDIHKISLFEGISDVLQHFSQQGAQLAVVSSNTYHNISQVLGPENISLFQYFECGVSLYGKTGRLKNVIRQSGIPGSQAISIGDEIRDLEAAHRARMDFGAVSWGYTSIESLMIRTPELIFNRVDELRSMISG